MPWQVLYCDFSDNNYPLGIEQGIEPEWSDLSVLDVAEEEASRSNSLASFTGMDRISDPLRNSSTSPGVATGFAWEELEEIDIRSAPRCNVFNVRILIRNSDSLLSRTFLILHSSASCGRDKGGRSESNAREKGQDNRVGCRRPEATPSASGVAAARTASLFDAVQRLLVNQGPAEPAEAAGFRAALSEALGAASPAYMDSGAASPASIVHSGAPIPPVPAAAGAGRLAGPNGSLDDERGVPELVASSDEDGSDSSMPELVASDSDDSDGPAGLLHAEAGHAFTMNLLLVLNPPEAWEWPPPAAGVGRRRRVGRAG